MAQQRGQGALLLPLHEQRQEVFDLTHGYIALVVAADQGLRVGREGLVTPGIRRHQSAWFSPCFSEARERSSAFQFPPLLNGHMITTAMGFRALTEAQAEFY